MTHILLSAAHKSSGKTTLAIGLARAFSDQGLAVQPFKKGPDYIDPIWLGRAARRACINLDFHTMDANEIVAAVARRLPTGTLGLIEGNKGLHDGVALDGSNSNAALARRLGAPVVLVLEARGMTRSIAPLVLGFQAFDREVRIGGVILNRVGGARHEAKLRAALGHYTDVAVLGAMPEDPALHIQERHLGLVPGNEDTGAEARIRILAQRVAEHVDLEALRALAATARNIGVAGPETPSTAIDTVRIGFLRDSAFGFYYPDDLEALQQAGAELVPIDSLSDARLPRVDGLFIGGGFPETHMQALESNGALRTQIHAAIEDGLPSYAECGGLMYLARGLRWGERRCEMVGVIPAEAVMQARPCGRGYVRLKETANGLWSPLGAGGPSEIAAHEFHYSRLEGLPDTTRYAYEMLRGDGIDGRHDGIVHRNLLASYAHLRHTAHNPWAARFVAFVQRCRAQRPAGERSAARPAAGSPTGSTAAKTMEGNA